MNQNRGRSSSFLIKPFNGQSKKQLAPACQLRGSAWLFWIMGCFTERADWDPVTYTCKQLCKSEKSTWYSGCSGLLYRLVRLSSTNCILVAIMKKQEEDRGGLAFPNESYQCKTACLPEMTSRSLWVLISLFAMIVTWPPISIDFFHDKGIYHPLLK